MGAAGCVVVSCLGAERVDHRVAFEFDELVERHRLAATTLVGLAERAADLRLIDPAEDEAAFALAQAEAAAEAAALWEDMEQEAIEADLRRLLDER